VYIAFDYQIDDNNAGTNENHLFLSISDDGVGFATQEKSTGFGMTSLKERSKYLGASLDVQSAVNKGSKIKISFAVGS
jgi:signal transduction histidine kinase